MSIPSQVESAFVQTVPGGKSPCPEFPAFISRIRAFSRLLCVQVQTFVLATDFCVFVSRPSYFSQNFCALMSRFSCVNQIFVRSFNIVSCNHIQSFVRSSDFPFAFSFRLVIIETVLLINYISVYFDINFVIVDKN